MYIGTIISTIIAFVAAYLIGQRKGADKVYKSYARDYGENWLADYMLLKSNAEEAMKLKDKLIGDPNDTWPNVSSFRGGN